MKASRCKYKIQIYNQIRIKVSIPLSPGRRVVAGSNPVIPTLKIKRLDQKPDLFFIVAIKVLLRFLGNLMHQILMAILNSFGIISFNQL